MGRKASGIIKKPMSFSLRQTTIKLMQDAGYLQKDTSKFVDNLIEKQAIADLSLAIEDRKNFQKFHELIAEIKNIDTQIVELEYENESNKFIARKLSDELKLKGIQVFNGENKNAEENKKE